MKQSDIITVVLIAAIGVVVSAIGCNAILGNPDEASVSFKTVEMISGDLAQPDSEVFNPSAVNPTVEVYVGNCADVDQNGSLDSAELLACGQKAEEVENEEDDEDVNENANASEKSTKKSTDTRSTTDEEDEDVEEDANEDDEE